MWTRPQKVKPYNSCVFQNVMQQKTSVNIPLTSALRLRDFKKIVKKINKQINNKNALYSL